MVISKKYVAEHFVNGLGWVDFDYDHNGRAQEEYNSFEEAKAALNPFLGSCDVRVISVTKEVEYVCHNNGGKRD